MMRPMYTDERSSRTWSWETMVALEPRLGELLRIIRTADVSEVDFDQLWYKPRGLKAALCRLVGWGAAHPLLRSEVCYELAYDKLYTALEDRAAGVRRYT